LLSFSSFCDGKLWDGGWWDGWWCDGRWDGGKWDGWSWDDKLWDKSSSFAFVMVDEIFDRVVGWDDKWERAKKREKRKR